MHAPLLSLMPLANDVAQQWHKEVGWEHQMNPCQPHQEWRNWYLKHWIDHPSGPLLLQWTVFLKVLWPLQPIDEYQAHKCLKNALANYEIWIHLPRRTGKFILCFYDISFNMVLTFMILDADYTGHEDDDNEMPPPCQPCPVPPAPIKREPP